MILNLNKKTKDEIIWQEISTNSQTVDISEIKLTHHGLDDIWNGHEISLTPQNPKLIRILENTVKEHEINMDIVKPDFLLN